VRAPWGGAYQGAAARHPQATIGRPPGGTRSPARRAESRLALTALRPDDILQATTD